MKPIILLDIDEVLSPKVSRGSNPDAPEPRLSDACRCRNDFR